MLQIVGKFISELQQQLNRRKVVITLSEGAVKWLADRGYDSLYGARPLARLVQEELKDALSEELLFGKLSKGGKVHIELENGRLSFSYPG